MSNKKGSELDAIRARRAKRGTTEVADWGTVNTELLRDAIAVVAARGGALRFGYTRDGGAYAIGVYISNDKWTEYIRPHEDIDQYLTGLIVDIGNDV